MPEKVEIFVASSHHAKQEAETLATELTKYEDQYNKYTLHATTWFDRGSVFINILDDLLDKTATYDFAVIVLTSRVEEIASIPSEMEDEKRRMRYNTIYEAGLFGGALGPDKNRVFLVIDAGVRDLPSDLGGIKYDKFEENNKSARLAKIAQDIASTICDYSEEKIHAMRGLKRPVITTEQLCKREAIRKTGALVFVNTAEPIESGNTVFANRVIQNVLGDSDIKYTYVFENTDSNKTTVCCMLGALLEAAIVRANTLASNDRVTATNMVKEYLGAMDRPSFRRNLKIFFVNQYPPFEFCVHNADDSIHARCYMRSRPFSEDIEEKVIWVEWCKGRDARDFSREIVRISQGDELEPMRIFHNTRDCPILERKPMVSGESTPQFKLSKLGEELLGIIKFSVRDRLQAYEMDICKACFGFDMQMKA